MAWFKKKHKDKVVDDGLRQQGVDCALKDMAKNRDKLDFSNESIKVVEEFLAGVHNDFVKDKNEEGLFGVALECAFYIMATAEKNYGKGVAKQDHPEMGEGTYPFTIGTMTIFPWAWCMKRIYDGPADNVWTKYQSLVIEKLAKN